MRLNGVEKSWFFGGECIVCRFASGLKNTLCLDSHHLIDGKFNKTGQESTDKTDETINSV